MVFHHGHRKVRVLVFPGLDRIEGAIVRHAVCNHNLHGVARIGLLVQGVQQDVNGRLLIVAGNNDRGLDVLLESGILQGVIC